MHKSIYSKLIVLALFYIIFNHLAACILFFTANLKKDSNDPDSMIKVMNSLTLKIYHPFIE